ncbi:MAG: stage II sporulation protein R [Clostridiaceae bacterium]|jgi:stage II sporulation protein R|nr:stage II sporulation protein R [Clostridiaceae bacterium]
MKRKTIIILTAALSVIFTLALAGCGEKENPYGDAVRIHIRANSNEKTDQDVKLKVRDAVVSFLTPLLVECKDRDGALAVISASLDGIAFAADAALKENGFGYTASVRLAREEFPKREYLEYTFESGFYDALIVELGIGKGDNWWCVAFPPLCFVGDGSGGDVVYKSKIKELIDKYFGDGE